MKNKEVSAARMELMQGTSDMLILKTLVLGPAHGLQYTLAGIGLGGVGALALAQFMARLLYGVKPTDPLTFLGVSVILLAVAAIASYLPSRRATRVDPMAALRSE